MIIVCSIFAVLFLLTLFPVTVLLELDGTFSLKVKVFGIVFFTNIKQKKPKKTERKTEKPQPDGDKQEQAKEKKKEKKDAFGDFLQNAKAYFEILKEILSVLTKGIRKHLVISELSLQYRFGFGDAAATGIVAGGIYAVAYSFLGWIRQSMHLQKENVQITPDFQTSMQQVSVRLCLKMRIMFALLLLWRVLKVAWKGYRIYSETKKQKANGCLKIEKETE